MTATAEHGKARYVGIGDLQAGMKVQKDVLGRKEKVLVNAGEVLTKTHIDKLKKWEAREKPMGAVLPKVNPKDKTEGIRRGDFVGGYKVTHFNPRGIFVTNTLATGDEFPAVEQDPEKSKVIQNAERPASFNVGDVGVDSPLMRKWKLESEIKALERMNAKLGGDLHTVEGVFATEEELTARRDALEKQNQELIDAKDAKPDAPAKRGRPRKE
jgi:hypothetical protein